MAGEGKRAVVLAMVGNGFITLAKTGAAIVSGSGALRAEAVHSLVDTLNQGFLLIGVSRAGRRPTHRFPYGFGAEANFWALLASIIVLLFGGIQTIEHGFHAWVHPEVPTEIGWVLGVLAVAIVIELYVLVMVLKHLASTRASRSWRDHLASQAPGTTAVLVEDAAAVVGSALAAAAVLIAHRTGEGRWDAGCQILIGAMLAAVGLYLIVRNHRGLLGEAAPPDEVRRLYAFIAGLPGVDRVTAVKTRMLSASTYRLKAEVVFSGGYLAGRVIAEALEPAPADASALPAYLGAFSDRVLIEQARHVDLLEAEIHQAFPGVVHIALEPHLREDQARDSVLGLPT